MSPMLRPFQMLKDSPPIGGAKAGLKVPLQIFTVADQAMLRVQSLAAGGLGQGVGAVSEQDHASGGRSCGGA